jgi:hypothetical protein
MTIACNTISHRITKTNAASGESGATGEVIWIIKPMVNVGSFLLFSFTVC